MSSVVVSVFFVSLTSTAPKLTSLKLKPTLPYAGEGARPRAHPLLNS